MRIDRKHACSSVSRTSSCSWDVPVPDKTAEPENSKSFSCPRRSSHFTKSHGSAVKAALKLSKRLLALSPIACAPGSPLACFPLCAVRSAQQLEPRKDTSTVNAQKSVFQWISASQISARKFHDKSFNLPCQAVEAKLETSHILTSRIKSLQLHSLATNTSSLGFQQPLACSSRWPDQNTIMVKYFKCPSTAFQKQFATHDFDLLRAGTESLISSIFQVHQEVRICPQSKTMGMPRALCQAAYLSYEKPSCNATQISRLTNTWS